MPELVPALDRLAAQLDRPGGETFLTFAALRPFFAGCTPIGGAGTLLRNYDFDPGEVQGVIAYSRFRARHRQPVRVPAQRGGPGRSGDPGTGQKKGTPQRPDP